MCGVTSKKQPSIEKGYYHDGITVCDKGLFCCAYSTVMDVCMSTEVLKMKYAFAFYFVKRIVWADNILADGEREYIEEWFPQSLLVALGIHKEEECIRYYQSARKKLVEALKEEEKHELFGLLLGACVADDYLDYREFVLLDEAAKILGLGNQQMFELMEYYLETNITLGAFPSDS